MSLTFGRFSYEQIDERSIPSAVRFDVPATRAGQIVEYAFGGFDCSQHDAGDLYARRKDLSDRSVTYYRLRKVVIS